MINRNWIFADDICWQTVTSFEPGERDLLVFFPGELRNEPILKNNIPKMLKVIREYVNEERAYQLCMKTVDVFYFDSQKLSMKTEAYKHRDRADKLSNIMNENISPYFWRYTDGFCGYINGTHVSSDYIIYLDKKLIS